MVSDSTMGCTLRGGSPTRPLPDANHPMVHFTREGVSLEIVEFRNKLPTIYGTLPGSMLASKATVNVFSSVAWKKALDNSLQVISVRA